MSDLRTQLLEANDGYMSREELRKRISANMQRDLPEIRYAKNQTKAWAVIGTGPSVVDCVPDIRRLKREGVNIVSVNKAHDWLLEHGVVPWGHVLLDGHQWVADYVKRPRQDVRYFIASQCHDDTFDRFKGYPVFLWHGGQDFPGGSEPDKMFRERGYGFQPIIGGGTTVGQRVPIIGHALGARRFHMFGMDSSRREGNLHAIPKKDVIDPKNRSLGYRWNGRKWWFDTNVHMARQQMDFDKLIEDLPARWRDKQIAPDFQLIFHGSGLTPFWAATLGLHANPDCNNDPPSVGGYTEVTDDYELQDFSLAQPIGFGGQAIVIDMDNPQ